MLNKLRKNAIQRKTGFAANKTMDTFLPHHELIKKRKHADKVLSIRGLDGPSLDQYSELSLKGDEARRDEDLLTLHL
eukprot:4116922-Amphidinium_carterae.1